MRSALVLALVCAGCGSESAPETPAPQGPVDDGFSPTLAVDLDPDPNVVRYHLTAQFAAHDIGGVSHVGYGYDGRIPGPTLHGKLGDRMIVELENGLPDPTTIHWHGMKVPYEMDGVTWQSDPIQPHEAFTYDFPLERAGTFWYHPHFATAAQVENGLYGFVVVEDPEQPAADRELLVALDVLGEDTGDGGTVHHCAPGAPRAEDGGIDAGHGAHPAPGTAFWIANGRFRPTARLEGGERVRVRLLNASNESYLDLRGEQIRQIGSDQGLLPALTTQDSLLLAPGDRAELEWLVGEDGFAIATKPYSLAGGATLGQDSPLFEVAVDSPAAAPAPIDWPFSGEAPTTDTGATDVLYVLTGEPGNRDWRINGELYPNVTIEELARDADAVIEVRNISATEHPFHLHGNWFEVLSVNGVAPKARTLEDTVNLAVRDVVRLRLVADNPGEWMAHCHILTHADQGMMTVLRVLE